MVDHQEGEEPLVFIIHDESTFNENDGKRKIWKMEGTNPLQPKGKGKGIMVSGFLTRGGPLKIPDNILDEELLKNPMWPHHPSTGQPIREAFEFLEYGKDNYWNGESIVEQTIRAALPILRYAFPRCCGVWAFNMQQTTIPVLAVLLLLLECAWALEVRLNLE
jgi:hypothetical protein